MDKIEFDIVKLKQLCNVNVAEAVKRFNSYEEYFLELSNFTKEAEGYLSEYTAGESAERKAEYANLRDDLKKIRIRLISLGVTRPVSTLSELSYEAESGSKESLEKWINIFRDELAKAAEDIKSAQIIIEEPAKEAPVSAAKPIILAADDKPELLTAVVNMLGDGFKVMAATSGRAALKIIEKHSPELFLLDIEMPQMDGYELAKAIRKQKKFEQTPIIFLTGKNSRESVISAISHGGNDYLVKPVDKNLLLSKVMQHLKIDEPPLT